MTMLQCLASNVVAVSLLHHNVYMSLTVSAKTLHVSVQILAHFSKFEI